MIASALRIAGVLVVTVLALGGSLYAQEDTPSSDEIYLYKLEEKADSLITLSDRLDEVDETLRGLSADLWLGDGWTAGVLASEAAQASLSLVFISDLLFMSTLVSDQNTGDAVEMLSDRLDWLIDGTERSIDFIDATKDDISSHTLSGTAERLALLLGQAQAEFSDLKVTLKAQEDSSP